MSKTSDQYIPEHPVNPIHLDTELNHLRKSLMDMWSLVISQLNKAEEALFTNDKNLAKEIKVNEKRVDAFELSIIMDCENILALLNPVAADLRFVLAVLKIAYNLERTGDYAKSIAGIVEDINEVKDKEIFNTTGIPNMFSTTLTMMNDVYHAFETNDNRMVRSIFTMDEVLDNYNRQANDIFTNLIAKQPENTRLLINLLSVVRRLERIGDQSKNIAEEIIFYIEASTVKHDKKKKLTPPEGK